SAGAQPEDAKTDDAKPEDPKPEHGKTCHGMARNAQEGRMNRLVIAGALALTAVGQALAADLPQPVPPPGAPVVYLPVAQVYNWGGIYYGINGGYGFGNTNWTDPNNFS